MSINISVRSLSGTVDAQLPDNATVADVKEAISLAEGSVLRLGGQPVSDDTPVTDGSTLVAAPPQAKHGA